MCTNLDLKVFDGQDKSELSMIEVAHAILAHHGEAMAFVDLTNEVQQYLGKSDEEIRERLAQFYTDLNVDGSFISLGDNTWGLRAWYPFESIDEATVGENEEDRCADRAASGKRRGPPVRLLRWNVEACGPRDAAVVPEPRNMGIGAELRLFQGPYGRARRRSQPVACGPGPSEQSVRRHPPTQEDRRSAAAHRPLLRA